VGRCSIWYGVDGIKTASSKIRGGPEGGRFWVVR